MYTVGGRERERERTYVFNLTLPALPFLPLSLSLLATLFFIPPPYSFLLSLSFPLFSYPPCLLPSPLPQPSSRSQLPASPLISIPSPFNAVGGAPPPSPVECQGVPSRALPRSVYSYLCGGRDTRHAPPTSAETRYFVRAVT